MRSLIKRVLKGILGARIASAVIDYFQMLKFSKGTLSYSQEGEDRLLANIFRGKKTGFYIDVGAHHPFCLSNTHLFYREGWNGINIDANPDCMNAFHHYRPRDINITSGVGQADKEMTFYKFAEPALSSFNKELSLLREAQGRKIYSTALIQVKPLKQLLEKYLISGREIDFMNIDVEGFDLDVLKSNDWSQFRPKCILVECVNLELEKINENETCLYLTAQGYHFFAKLVNTCFFVD